MYALALIYSSHRKCGYILQHISQPRDIVCMPVQASPAAVSGKEEGQKRYEPAKCARDLRGSRSGGFSIE